MKLQKPPIVENWIEFHFQGSDTQSELSQDAVEGFFSRIRDDFPDCDAIIEEQFRVEKRRPTGVPEKINVQRRPARVRAFDKDKHRCVQVAPNVLVVNLTTRGTEYPGFPDLVDRAFEHLVQYREHFQPDSVREVALHYTDLVKLPWDGKDKIKLEEWFELGPRLPDPEWDYSSFEMNISIPLSDEAGSADYVDLVFRSESSDAERHEFRFRMDWHGVARDVDTMEETILRMRLEGLRTEIGKMFRQCFTECAWSLFEESEA